MVSICYIIHSHDDIKRYGGGRRNPSEDWLDGYYKWANKSEVRLLALSLDIGHN